MKHAKERFSLNFFLMHFCIGLVESVHQLFAIFLKSCKALKDSQYNDVVLPCFYLVMIIFGLIGNIIVIYVTNKQKRKSVVDQYVKNLAIAGKKICIVHNFQKFSPKSTHPYDMLHINHDVTLYYQVAFLTKNQGHESRI